MIYQRFGSLVAAFFLSTLGWMSASQAHESSAQPQAQAPSNPSNQTQPPGQPFVNPSQAGDAPLHTGVPQHSPVSSSPEINASNVAPETRSGTLGDKKPGNEKLGEQKQGDRAATQSTRSARQTTIAKVETHRHGDRQAATVYLRNIPVLTFLGEQMPTQPQAAATGSTATKAEAETAKLPTPTGTQGNDPLTRASALAAQINQFNRDGLDANTIGAKWDDKQKAYIIHVGDKTLVELDPKTAILPDTTQNSTRDVLQATNRMRRLLGQASPLKEVANRPQPIAAVAPPSASVIDRAAGWASWYGPGFHGALSASGEVFNQNAMTAAHRHLPFGTRVRVTNTDNGRSVVVRINDRGPFIGGRVIDVSMGAANALGMTGSGVAPVKLEILGR